jgi:hypothetical protein
MIDLTAEPAELAMTIEVTRATTGLKEVFDLVGHVVGYEKLDNDEEL